MKSLLTLVLVLMALVTSAQKTFNYKKDFKDILEKTKDPNDKLNYNTLLKRFSLNDTTLTDYEVLALLIGFTGKPEYQPYSDLDKEREIYKLNGDGKFQNSLDSGMKFIKTHPLSVKTLFEISYSYHKLDKEDSAKSYLFKGRKIFKAMYFSGNGKTPETPTFALGPADGQDYLYKFAAAGIGTMGSGSDSDGNFLDILEAKFKDGETITLYFIIEHATKKMFSEKDLKSMEETLEKIQEKKKKSK
jgi:hypothetical protein